MNPEKAYKNLTFLNSPEARSIRILCEYEEPLQRFLKEQVSDTIVFFGSARAKSEEDLNKEIQKTEKQLQEASADQQESLQAALLRLNNTKPLTEYYEKTRELARRITEWDLKRFGTQKYFVTTGGGPGIMEAANRGASEVEGGKSVGLGISLPFEAGLNPYVTPELGFEFHYFFTRKYWFLYLCKAMVICPGGFGTLDELFEALTLRQTGKITKPIPTVLFGTEYWNSLFNLDVMVKWGTISPQDVDLMFITDSIDDAFDYLVEGILAAEREDS